MEGGQLTFLCPFQKKNHEYLIDRIKVGGCIEDKINLVFIDFIVSCIEPFVLNDLLADLVA